MLYKFVEERLSPLQKIPCPPGGLPLIGHLLTLLRSGGFLEKIRTWTKQYPSMFILHPGFGIGIGRSIKFFLILALSGKGKLIPVQNRKSVA